MYRDALTMNQRPSFRCAVNEVISALRSQGSPHETQTSVALLAWIDLMGFLIPALTGRFWICRRSIAVRGYAVETISIFAGSSRFEVHAATHSVHVAPRKVAANANRIGLTRCRRLKGVFKDALWAPIAGTLRGSRGVNTTK